MRALGLTIGLIVSGAFMASVAFGNPSLLPAHPGYPAAGKSPVTGQSLANDSGQGNMVGEKALVESAEFGQNSVSQDQKSMDQNNQNVTRQGAGQLPKVESAIQAETAGINPSGAQSTKIGR